MVININKINSINKILVLMIYWGIIYVFVFSEVIYVLVVFLAKYWKGSILNFVDVIYLSSNISVVYIY